MKRKLLATALCLSVTAAVFTACSDTNSEESVASQAAETVNAAETEQTAAETEAAEETVETFVVEDDTFSYPLTLEDAYGNVVTVEEEPETIVTVSPALIEIVYAPGGEDKLIG